MSEEKKTSDDFPKAADLQADAAEIQQADTHLDNETDAAKASPSNAEEVAGKIPDLESLQNELQEAQERFLRSQAELDNVRKRTRRELEERTRYGALPIASDLLSVVDNLHRALEAAPQSEDATGFIQGVRMVFDQLVVVLEKNHCEKISAVGQPFDPNFHEAIQMESSDEFAANTVSREIQIGYQIFDRVLRPTQVFVSTGPATEDSAPTA